MGAAQLQCALVQGTLNNVATYIDSVLNLESGTTNYACQSHEILEYWHRTERNADSLMQLYEKVCIMVWIFKGF